MKENCLIYNFAQHYRYGIFSLIDESNNFDMYFGDSFLDVKKINYSNLHNFSGELKNISIFSEIYYQKGAVSLFFKPYKQYLILGEYYCISTWIILILSYFTSKKVFFWSHGWYGDEGLLKKIVKTIFFKMSDGVFLYGNYAKDLMIKRGFNHSKLHVIYNSLNYKEQLDVRKKLKSSKIFNNYFNNTNHTLIFIGRLTKVKKLELLIDAQNELQKKGTNLNLVFVGTGTEEFKLKKLVAKYKLDKACWFYGPTYNEFEIGKLIFNADLCVSPGNVGLTAMHSLVYGTPVISNSDFSNQMPEFEAIIPNVTGDFFKKDSLNDLVSVIDKMLIQNENKALRLNCFKVIDKFYNPQYQYSLIKKIILKNEMDIKKN